MTEKVNKTGMKSLVAPYAALPGMATNIKDFKSIKDCLNGERKIIFVDQTMEMK